MMWWLMAWFVCGILAYGLNKGVLMNIEERYPDSPSIYGMGDELMSLSLALCGPAFLMGVLVDYLLHPEITGKIRICFRVPKNVRDKSKNQ